VTAGGPPGRPGARPVDHRLASERPAAQRGRDGRAARAAGDGRRAAQVSAAALISPVIQLAKVVAVNERRFGVSYPWSEASKAVAARFDFVSRAGEIAARDPEPAILLVTGAEDDPALPLQAQRLATQLRQRYSDPQRASLTSIPGMKHAFAAEPGIEPAPQTAEAKLLDAAVTGWFSRYLS
jgi:hypothetical protein